MMAHSLLNHRSFRRLTAMLAAGQLLLTTLPSRGEVELASLLPPSGAPSSDLAPDHGFSPESAPLDPVPAIAEAERPSVKISMERADSHETVTIDLPRDGQLVPEDVRVVAHFFRCRRTGRQRPISPGVLAMLADVAAQWPERSIQIVSGFRAPPYGAPHSKHFKGQAIDLRIPGIRTTAVRDYVWRAHHDVGVGYYQKESFVHIDSRPGAQDRAWSGAEEGGPELRNPRWARRARRHMPAPGATPEALPVPYALSPAANVQPMGTVAGT